MGMTWLQIVQVCLRDSHVLQSGNNSLIEAHDGTTWAQEKYSQKLITLAVWTLVPLALEGAKRLYGQVPMWVTHLPSFNVIGPRTMPADLPFAQ